MLDYIYPEEEQRFFTNREHTLAVLGLSQDLLAQGVRKHLALSGFRRVGKTVVLKEFLRRSLQSGSADDCRLVYVDLPRLALTPEAFAMQYLGYLLYWVIGDFQTRLESLLDAPAQLVAVGRMGLAGFNEHVVRLHQELQKEKPDQHLLLELAFDAPEVYARTSGRRVMLILDEFPEIMALNNYPQIRDVLALFRAVLQSQSRVAYVVAGSMIGLMERIFLDAESPLFVHFQMETVGPFGRDDCDALARKRLSMLADPVPGDVLAAIYQVTRGHPFYIYATAMRVIENASLLHKPLTPATVQEAFTLETLGSTGRIYNLCRYVLEQSLQGVRGETMPQAVLQVLAQEPAGMTLTEIANRLKRPSGAIRQVLIWLVDVDLVEQREDKTYGYRDPVLQIWVAYFYSGLQLSGLPSPKVLSCLVAELMEKYERVANELGLAKESQVRELLQAFAGQEVDGRLFGMDGVIKLPVFQRVAPYLSQDGQIQVDSLAENHERWAVELKWRGRLSGKKELEKLAANARSLSAKPWFISKIGFTQEALEYARQNSMMVSSQADLEALSRLVNS
ncbi:MAG: helix-turn-helix domain-containing protein [Anaerolineales bacterium]|nr:helix-turn-helix domain-containing protein [Anaerolineales bacterium]